jgi:PTS system glucitol/sorbitol-specific IIC component
MDALARGAEWFIGLFQAGADVFVALVTGIVPLLIILLTGVNAIIKFIGQERIDRVGELAGRPGIVYAPFRFLILPVIAVFFLTNPMCYTMGRFLPERNKAAFYDSAVSFVHPITGLFPHANAAELFVYLGIANGISERGLPLGDLAVRYLLVGLVVIFLRGLVTQGIVNFLTARRDRVARERAGSTGAVAYEGA